MPDTTDRVPRQVITDHVEALIARNPGLTITHIATLAGVAHSSIRDKRFDLVTRETAERVLAVTDRHARMAPVKVPVEPVAAHVERLLAVERAGVAALSRLSGVSTPGIRFVRAHRYPSVQWATARALLAITPEDMAAGTSFVPRERTAQQVQSLAALGWALGTQEALLDGQVAVRYLLTGASSQSPVVERRIAALVDDLYRRIGDTPGPNPVAARAAASKGWLTPIHYDEHGDLIEGSVRTVGDAEDVEDEQEAARARLACLGLSLDGLSPAAVAERLRRHRDWASAVRGRGGLRFDRLTGDLLPDCEAAVGRIRGALVGIDHRERTDLYDAPDLDYVERWLCIKRAAEQDKRRPAAVSAQAA